MKNNNIIKLYSGKENENEGDKFFEKGEYKTALEYYIQGSSYIHPLGQSMRNRINSKIESTSLIISNL